MEDVCVHQFFYSYRFVAVLMEVTLRLNIEERAFGDSRRKKLAHLLGFKENAVLGFLVLLWHGSQEAGKYIATRDEILTYCEEFDPEFSCLLFDGLLNAGYISHLAEDQYRIHGNEKQIAGLQKHKAKSVKGAKATKDKWAEIKKQEKLEGQKEGHRPSEDKATSPNSGTPDESSEQTLDRAHSHITIHSSHSQKEKREKKKVECDLDEIPFSSDAIASDLPPKSKTKIPKKWERKISDFDQMMAKTWMDYAKEKVPRGKFNEGEFQVAITKMRHEYKLSEGDITSLFSWCQESEFWKDKSFSPVGLLRRKGEKTNLDTILIQKSQQKKGLPPSNANRYKVDDGHEEYKRKLIAKVKAEQEGIT